MGRKTWRKQGQLHPNCRPGQEPAWLVHPSRSPVIVHSLKLPYLPLEQKDRLPATKCKNDRTMAHMTRRPEDYSGRRAVGLASGQGRAEYRKPLAAYVAAQQAARLVEPNLANGNEIHHGPILVIEKEVHYALHGLVR